MRAAISVAQHVCGVVNAFMFMVGLDDGHYGSAALSALCVLVTARWALPLKNPE